MIFANPLFLAFIPLIFALGWFRSKLKMRSTLRFAFLQDVTHLQDRKVVLLSKIVDVFRILLLIVLVVALARPQLVNVVEEVTSEGVDIMLVMDVSESMLAEDFKPQNRFEVARERVKSFIQKRSSDRIGLVVFGTEAFTQCPLTVDYSALYTLVDSMEVGMSGSGTAVGNAIATGLNRLKKSSSSSKVMILLTDGESNSGDIEPFTAAKLAEDLGVKIYTIGVGKSNSRVRLSDGRVMISQLDEETLRKIAWQTGGRYFNATGAKGLEDIYEQIDALETSEVDVTSYKTFHDFFPMLLWWAFGLFLAKVLLVGFVLRGLP